MTRCEEASQSISVAPTKSLEAAPALKALVSCYGVLELAGSWAIRICFSVAGVEHARRQLLWFRDQLLCGSPAVSSILRAA